MRDKSGLPAGCVLQFQDRSPLERQGQYLNRACKPALRRDYYLGLDSYQHHFDVDCLVITVAMSGIWDHNVILAMIQTPSILVGSLTHTVPMVLVTEAFDLGSDNHKVTSLKIRWYEPGMRQRLTCIGQPRKWSRTSECRQGHRPLASAKGRRATKGLLIT